MPDHVVLTRIVEALQAFDASATAPTFTFLETAGGVNSPSSAGKEGPPALRPLKPSQPLSTPLNPSQPHSTPLNPSQPLSTPQNPSQPLSTASHPHPVPFHATRRLAAVGHVPAAAAADRSHRGRAPGRHLHDPELVRELAHAWPRRRLGRHVQRPTALQPDRHSRTADKRARAYGSPHGVVLRATWWAPVHRTTCTTRSRCTLSRCRHLARPTPTPTARRCGRGTSPKPGGTPGCTQATCAPAPADQRSRGRSLFRFDGILEALLKSHAERIRARTDLVQVASTKVGMRRSRRVGVWPWPDRALAIDRSGLRRSGGRSRSTATWPRSRPSTRRIRTT